MPAPGLARGGAEGFRAVEEVWRRTMELNFRYYSAVGRLTADYLRDLVVVLSGLRSQAESGASTGMPAAGSVERSGPVSRPAPGAMVLEGEAGHEALGVFLVENHLGHDISARIVASPFADQAGREVRPTLRFEPDVVVLAPGEQLLVRVIAAIDETLESGVRYRGELTVPELQGTRVPIVLRRRPGREAPLAEPSGTNATSPVPQKGTSGRRARSVKPKRRSPAS